MTPCGPIEQLEQFLAGGLAEPAASALREHLAGCAECQSALDRLSDHPQLHAWTSACRSAPDSSTLAPGLGLMLENLRGTPPPDTPGSRLTRTSRRRAGDQPLYPNGSTLGNYRILEQVGRGGMGIVLKAYDSTLQRVVALKVLRAERVDDAARERFVREAQAAARIDHEHVVAVHSVASPPDGPPYLVMQFVPGPTVRQRIDEEQRLDPREAARIACQVADGLAAAHQSGVIHRDIKPSNIILDDSRLANAGSRLEKTPGGSRPIENQKPPIENVRAKIMDFGLVRIKERPGGITQEGLLAGTPEYMSPEQVRAPEKIDERADVYGLGVTLYEMLTGEVPFRGTPHMVLQQVLRDEPVPPRRFSDRIPRDLQTICLKAMAKEPERRYQTAIDLRDDLQRWLDGETIRARPVGRLERVWRWCRRNPLPASLVAAVALLLVLGTVGSVLVSRHDRSLRNDAEQAKQTAEENARESHERLVRQYVRQGMRLVDEGDLLTALPWFAEALRIDDEHPERRKLHRIRLAATIRQCPKLLQVWSGQSRLLRATMSPNGRHLAVGYEDGTAELCNVETGAQAALVSSGPVTALAFSPDSRLLLAATSTGATRLWAVSTGLAVIDLEHDVGVTGAAFARDGAKILTVCRDRHVRVWDVTGRKLVVELANGSEVAWGAFSPDGTQVVTACADQTVRVWNAATGECSAMLKHPSYVNRVEFSPDGRRVLAACGGFMQAGEARVWDLDTDPPRPLVLTHPEGVWVARFSPDGRRVLTGCWDGMARVWDLEQAKLDFSPLVHRGVLTQVAFSADGRHIVTCSYDRTARVWDAATGRPVSPPLPHGGFVMHGVLSEDGRRLMTRAWDHVARVWDLASGDDAVRLEHGSPVTHLAFSPDGLRLVTACNDGKARIWNTHTGRLLLTGPQHGGAVLSATFSPDGRLVATASADHTARVWNAETGEAGPTLKHSGAVQRIAFHSDGGRVVTASDDGTACIWDAATGQRLAGPLQHGASVRDASFSPDGRFIVSASYDKTARIWNAETGKQLGNSLAHECEVERASFDCSGRRVVTACWDGSLENRYAQVWDAATGRPLGKRLQHQDGVRHAEFSRDGQRVVTAGEDDTARVWDAATGQPLTSPMRGRGHVFHASFSSEGAWVATATRLSVAGVWDASTGEALTPPLAHDGPVNHIQVSPAGELVATASNDGAVRLFRLRPDERPASELVRLAQMFAANRVDDTGGLVPLEGAAARSDWPTLRPRYEDLCVPSTADRLAWHRAQAEACERGRLWSHALGHLNLALEIEAQSAMLRRRAMVFVELKRWEEAAADFARTLEPDRPDWNTLHHIAVLYLAAGRTGQYRGACARLLREFGPTKDAAIANTLAWMCSLAPDATADPDESVRLAQQAVDASRSHYNLNTLGAALYRANRHMDAIKQLDESIRAGGNDAYGAWDWLFLAMAHHRLGHANEARRWLDLAIKAIDTEAGASLSSLERLELRLLREEAERLLTGKD